MPERNILIVAIDGLRASALGAYGNTAYSTPTLDEFAAQSFLFDSCFAPSADPTANYRALWKSIHPLRADDYAAAASLPRLLAELGYQSTLVTDDEQIVMSRGASDFNACVQVAGVKGERAKDVPHTALARLFSEACAAIEAPHRGPQLTWVHARGMYGPWDAPLQLQDELLDDDELMPVENVAPPDFSVSEVDDPDTAFRYGAAYGAQVMVLDACWQALKDSVRIGDVPWLVILMGVRGFPLGEHRRVGGADPRLYVEQLHVPWLMRFPNGIGRLARSTQLVSQLDLLPTLLNWVEGSESIRSGRSDGMSALPLVDPTNPPGRDELVFGGATGCRGIRTPAWSLRYEPARDADGGELFVRPDDRWEANDVAGLCPEVVERLVARAEEVAIRIQTGESLTATPN